MPQHKLCTADIVRLSLDQFFALSQMHRHSRGATVDFRQPDRHYDHGDLTGSTTGSSSAKATTVIRTVADTRSGKQTLAVGFEGHVCSLPSHPGSVANALAYNAFVRDHPIKPLCNFTDRVACFTVFPDTVAMATPSPPGVNSYRPWPLAVAPIAGDGLPAPYVWCLVLSNSHPEHEMTAAVRVMSPDGHTWIRTFTERDRPLVVRADSWTLVKMCEAHVLAPMRVVVEWYRMRTVNGLGATDPSSTEMALQLDRFPSVFMDLYVVPKEQVANLEHLRVARARCIKSLWLTADDCKRNQLLVPGNDNVLDKLDATRFFFGHIARFRKALRSNPHSAPTSLIPPLTESTNPGWMHQTRSPTPQLDPRFQDGGPMHDFHMSRLLDSPPSDLTTLSISPVRPRPIRAKSAKRSRLSTVSVLAAATSSVEAPLPPWRAPATPTPTSAFEGLVSTMPAKANAAPATTMDVPLPTMASRFTPPSGRLTPPGVREMAERQGAKPGVAAARADSRADTIVLGNVFCGTGGVVVAPVGARAGEDGQVELVDLVSSDDD